MQEGILSLMQMAKTSAALGRLREAGLPYISVLLHPTTGGVAASFAMLGDVIIAEPKALIGFAGAARHRADHPPESCPPGFQRSEFLMEHGLLDTIVYRREMRGTLAQLLRLLGPEGGARCPTATSCRGSPRCGALGVRPRARSDAGGAGRARGSAAGASSGGAHRRHQRQGLDGRHDRIDFARRGAAHGALHVAPPQPIHRAHSHRRT